MYLISFRKPEWPVSTCDIWSICDFNNSTGQHSSAIGPDSSAAPPSPSEMPVWNPVSEQAEMTILSVVRCFMIYFAWQTTTIKFHHLSCTIIFEQWNSEELQGSLNGDNFINSAHSTWHVDFLDFRVHVSRNVWKFWMSQHSPNFSGT